MFPAVLLVKVYQTEFNSLLPKQEFPGISCVVPYPEYEAAVVYTFWQTGIALLQSCSGEDNVTGNPPPPLFFCAAYNIDDFSFASIATAKSFGVCI